MAATLKENVAPQVDNKTSKKKKTKGGDSTPASVPSQAPEEPKEEHVNGEASSESSYLKEISKNIRNLKKKIAASSKAESILAENKDKSPDELLKSRLINADQKAQLDKKPGLVAQLESYESQYEQYKKLDDDYQQKLSSEKDTLLTSHSEEIEKLKTSIRAEIEEEQKTLFTQKLLTLSRFLRTAAARRSDEETTLEDGSAFEGALLLVYGGDISAVRAMEKLIDGSEDIVPGVDSQETGFSFKHVRDASKSADDDDDDEKPEASVEAPLETAATEQIGSDPTIAHAGLTELDDNTVVANGDTHEAEPTSVPEAAIVDNAANEVAQAQWDANLSQSQTSGGFEIVEHPRDPAETETGLQATPAAATNTESWAEDVPTEAPVIPSAATPVDDGFHEVSHRSHRGRGGQHHEGGRGRGGFRGRGEGRGRGRGGFRGDGRGRGRGRGGGDRGRGGASAPAAPNGDSQ